MKYGFDIHPNILNKIICLDVTLPATYMVTLNLLYNVISKLPIQTTVGLH